MALFFYREDPILHNYTDSTCSNNDIMIRSAVPTWNYQMFLVQKHIIPSLGKIKLDKLSPHHIHRFYLSKVQEGLSSSYIRSMYSVLSKTLGAAERWGLIKKNVASLVMPPKVTERKMNVWAIDEVQRFLKASKNRKFYIAYVLAVYTGMRRGEILGLKWDDVDLEEGIIHVQRTLYKINNKIVFRNQRRAVQNAPLSFLHSSLMN